VHVRLALVVWELIPEFIGLIDFKKPGLSDNWYTNEKIVGRWFKELYPRLTFRAMNSFPPSGVNHGRFVQSSQGCSTEV
jgi:hypothetical protein